jgi:hypothetical protein
MPLRTEAFPKRPLCAICDQTNETMRLCEGCRADPMNAGWSEGDPAQLVNDVETVAQSTRLSDLSGRRIRPDGDRKRAILGLVYHGRIREAYRNRGPGRNKQPWLWRWRALNLSEIAFLVDCSPQAVRKVLIRVLS